MRLKFLLLAAIAGAIVTSDQLTKMFIHTRFQLGESITVIPHFFNITYVSNPAGAFGFLNTSHPTFRELFFLSMPPIALLIILMILRGIEEKDRWSIVALSLVFGGAIGNYIDRLVHGFVVDFLDFHIKGQYSWPAFNVADMGIVCGVSILLYLETRKFREASKDNDASAGTSA